MTSDKITAYKGFNQDLTCRDFQFEEGGTHETDVSIICESGFHACESPLDVFGYYPPGTSVYRMVELEGVVSKQSGDSKVAGSRIKIGASVSIAGLAAAHIEYVHERLNKAAPKASNTGYRSAASNTGDQSAASNTGDQSAASNTGDRSAASNTGYQSAASNTGYWSAASNTGDRSAASNTGNRSAASNTGDWSAASVGGSESVAIVTGYDSKASGADRCWIVLTERNHNGEILGVVAVKVGSRKNGTKVQPGVFYKLHGGKVVPA